MKTTITQHAFTTGIVGDNLAGRTDIRQLESGVKKAINVLPLEQGPLVGRTGTEFVAETKYSDKKTRLVPFRFSVDEAVTIEMGDYYIRFFINGAPVTSGGASYEIETPYSEDVIDSLSFSGIADLLLIAGGGIPPVTIARYSNTDWRLTTPLMCNGPFLTVNTDISKRLYLVGTLTAGEQIEIVGDLSEAVTGLTLDQFIGRLLLIQVPTTNLADGGYAFIQISARLSTTYTLGVMLNTPDALLPTAETSISAKLKATTGLSTWRLGAFSPQGQTASFLAYTIGSSSFARIFLYSATVSAALGTIAFISDISVVSEATGLVTDGHYFTGAYLGPGHVCLLYSVVAGTPTLIAQATGPTNWEWETGTPPAGAYGKQGTYAFDIFVDYYSTAKPYYGTGTHAKPTYWGTEWPSIVALHQERKIYANSPLQPETLWLSEVADYDSFMPVNDKNEVLDDSGFSYSLSGGDINKVVWILSATRLIIGTSGDEFVAETANTSEPITPTGVAFTRQSSRGSIDNQQALLVGNTAVYVQRLGSIVRGLIYDVASDKYKSLDLTKLADKILSEAGGASKSSYSPEPSSVIYFVTANKTLATLTYEQDDDVLAWAQIVLGGTNVEVSSVCIVPSSDNSFYDKYFLASRTINGSTKQYIERLTPSYTDRNYWCYLDCSLAYHNDAVAISTATGLDHLIGESVAVMADGEYIGLKVVSGTGTVALGAEYNHVVIGYPYQTTVQLLPVEAVNNESGSTYGKQKRTLGLSLQLLDTLDVSVGITADTLDAVVLDSDTELNTGVYPVLVEEGFNLRGGDLYLVHDKPYPFTLLTVTREVEFRG
jgi:hypothetical protein